MTPPTENSKRPEINKAAEKKTRHVFDSTRAYLESTVAEARVIENKTRYLLVLTLSASFGLVGFLTVTIGGGSTSAFLVDLTWVGGTLLLILAIASFILMWNLLPQHKVHHPGSELRSFAKKENNIYSRPLWQTILVESRSHQRRINANAKLNEQRGNRLKWVTYAVIISLATALSGFLILLIFNLYTQTAKLSTSTSLLVEKIPHFLA